MASQTMPWQVRLLMREIMQPTEACRQLAEEYFRPFFEVLMSIIDEIVGRKLPAVRRRQVAFSIIGQCLFYRVAGGLAEMLIDETKIDEQFELAALKSHITDFSLAAIRGIAVNDTNQSVDDATTTDQT